MSDIEIEKSTVVNNMNRCVHTYGGGHACRLPRSEDSEFYCNRHIHLQPPDGAPIDLSHELCADKARFTSARSINRSLGKIFQMLAQDRISTRRATVLAYTCNLLLHSINAIERQRLAKEAQIESQIEAENEMEMPTFNWGPRPDPTTAEKPS